MVFEMGIVQICQKHEKHAKMSKNECFLGGVKNWIVAPEKSAPSPLTTDLNRPF